MRFLSLLTVCAVICSCGPSGADVPDVLVIDRFEDDNTKESASEVKIGKYPLTHTLDSTDDVDWMRVRVDEADSDGGDALPNIKYWIPIADRSGNDPAIKDYDGNPLLVYPGTSGGYFFYPPTPGIYFVEVTSATAPSATYVFGTRKWRQFDPLDSQPGDYMAADLIAPATIAEGEAFSCSLFAGNINSDESALGINAEFYLSTDDVIDGGDFKLTIGAGEGIISKVSGLATYAINVTADNAPTSSDIATGPLYLIAELLTPLAPNEYTDKNDIAITSLMFGSNLEDSFEGDGVTDGDNNLTLLAALARGDINEAGNAEVHTIYPALDEDIIPLDIDATDISTTPIFEIYTTDVMAGLDTCIELLDATETVLATAERGALDDNASRLVYNFTTDGDYYIRVTDKVHMVDAVGTTPATGATGAYSLVVRKSADAPDTLEPDDTFNPQLGIATWRELKPAITGTSGTGIYQDALGETLSRSFHCDGDVDYLIYPVPPLETDYTRTHSIVCTEAASLSLYDAYGNLVAGPSTNTLVPLPTLAAGLYYIKIESLPTGTTYDISATIANTAL